MKLRDFLFSSEFHIENESKIDEINIKVRNRTKLNVVLGMNRRCIELKNFGLDPALSTNQIK